MRFVSERKQTHKSSQGILQSAPIQLPISEHNQVFFTYKIFDRYFHYMFTQCTLKLRFSFWRKPKIAFFDKLEVLLMYT